MDWGQAGEGELPLSSEVFLTDQDRLRGKPSGAADRTTAVFRLEVSQALSLCPTEKSKASASFAVLLLELHGA